MDKVKINDQQLDRRKWLKRVAIGSGVAVTAYLGRDGHRNDTKLAREIAINFGESLNTISKKNSYKENHKKDESLEDYTNRICSYDSYDKVCDRLEKEYYKRYSAEALAGKKINLELFVDSLRQHYIPAQDFNGNFPDSKTLDALFEFLPDHKNFVNQENGNLTFFETFVKFYTGA